MHQTQPIIIEPEKSAMNEPEYFRAMGRLEAQVQALTAAVNLEPDASARIAVRSAVNHHYLDVLRPLLESAAKDGWIRSDADIDAGLSLLLMIMPHLALAPGNPGVDPVLGLDSDSDEVRREGVHRLLLMFRQALEPAAAG